MDLSAPTDLNHELGMDALSEIWHVWLFIRNNLTGPSLMVLLYVARRSANLVLGSVLGYRHLKKAFASII